MRLFRETPVLLFHYKAYICILLVYSLKYMVIFYQKTQPDKQHNNSDIYLSKILYLFNLENKPNMTTSLIIIDD